MAASPSALLFARRTEYPLPKQPSTADFIYYYGPNDDYSRHAQGFLDRVYPRHFKRRVGSLMEVIDHLHDRVTNGGVARIREIVLVGHANPHELVLPVIPNPPAGYKSVNAASLHKLQAAFAAGGDPVLDRFNDRRRVVVSHLDRSSFVTLRVCRFGRSELGMFALYSFFGGHANVYAPKSYMFFANVPIGPNRRFRTVTEVAEHLASQRLVRSQPRSPNRQAALVTMLAEPGAASDTIVVAEADLAQQNTEATQYLADVADLNKGVVPARLRSALEEQLGIILDAKPTVSLPVSNTSQVLNGAGRVEIRQWTIRERTSSELDVLEPKLGFKPSAILSLECTVSDARPNRAGARASLEVVGRVVERDNARGARPARGRSRVNFQLVVDEFDMDRFRGVLGELASHQVVNPAPDDVTAVSAIEEALGVLVNGDDIEAATTFRKAVAERTFTEIPDGDLTVTAEAISPDLQAMGVRKAWTVEAVDETFGVEVVEHELDTGQRAMMVRLRKKFRAGEKARHEEQLVNDHSWGASPDVPGTELMSYLDGLSTDELMTLIDYLDEVRDVRRTELGPVWRHAVGALHDKKDQSWEQEIRNANLDDPLFPLDSRYYDIYKFDGKIGAVLDLSKTSYPFRSRSHWAQVRESNPSAPPPVADLFSEQTLPVPPPHLIDREPATPDSPTVERIAVSQTELDILETFSSTAKLDLPVTADPADNDCATFARMVNQLSTLTGVPEDSIDAAIAALESVDEIADPSLYEALKTAYAAAQLLGMQSLEERAVIKLVERFPRLGLGGGALTPRAVWGIRAFSFGSSMYTVVGWMFFQMIKESEAKRAAETAEGAQTALRTYARRLRQLAREHPTDFPETIPFSIDAPPGADRQVWAMRMWMRSRGITDSRTFAPGPKAHADGYEKGTRLVEELVAKELRWAVPSMNRQLRQSGLTECMITAMQSAGWLDPPRIRAAVMLQVSDALDRGAREMFKRRGGD
jgi:hypothetical protein